MPLGARRILVERSRTDLVRAGLVAEYRFDEGAGTTLTDYANGFNGSLAAPTATPVWNSQGLTFDATDDKVSLPQADVQVANQLAHTVMLVCKTPRVNELLYSEGTGGSAEWFYLELTPATGRAKARWRRESVTAYDVPINTTNAVAANTWCCITARRNGVNADVSLNAVFASQGSSALLGSQALGTRGNAFINAPTGSALPGSSGLSAAYMLFYYRYLSNSEVTANYNALKTILSARGIALP